MSDGRDAKAPQSGKSACNLEGSAARAVTAECTTAFLDLISFAVLQFQILRTRDPERLPAALRGCAPAAPRCRRRHV